MLNASIQHQDAETAERSEKLQTKTTEWRNYCTPERGYDWNKSNSRTRYLEKGYLNVCQEFLDGKVDLRAVYDVFIEYAKAHKPQYVLNQINRSTGEMLRTRCVTPQVELQPEQMERALTMFGIEESEYMSHGKLD